jgi:hypothetical protein
MEPEAPDEPEPIEPEPAELPGWSVADPEEPLPDVPDDPAEEPDDPEPVAPLLDCAPAGSAMSRLAIPSPATIPFLIFM